MSCPYCGMSCACAAIDELDELIEIEKEMKAVMLENENLKLANEEARKTIDRLCQQIPRDANSGGG